MDVVKLISNVLSNEDFNRLQLHFKGHTAFDNILLDEFGRKLLGENTESILTEFSNILLPIAKEVFNSDTLRPSNSLFAEYSGDTISLHKHTDANACTYTRDLVLYQDSPWGLWVNGVEYLANENEAICFMGETSEHWRDTITNNKNKIGAAFFHYVEPDHWFFDKGKEYVEVIRNNKRENGS